MPFIRRQDVDPVVRQRFEETHKASLRAALLNPTLTEEQRNGIKTQLDTVGRPKVYRADSPPRPGAIAFPPRMTREQLEGLKRPDLVALATRLNLPSQGRKVDLVERLLQSQAVKK